MLVKGGIFVSRARRGTGRAEDDVRVLPFKRGSGMSLTRPALFLLLFSCLLLSSLPTRGQRPTSVFFLSFYHFMRLYTPAWTPLDLLLRVGTCASVSGGKGEEDSSGSQAFGRQLWVQSCFCYFFWVCGWECGLGLGFFFFMIPDTMKCSLLC